MSHVRRIFLVSLIVRWNFQINPSSADLARANRLTQPSLQMARAKNLKSLNRDVDLPAFAKSNGNAVRMLALVTELSSPNLDGNHKELLISVSCRGATKRFDIQKDSRPTGTSQKAELKVMRARQSSSPLNNHAISTSTTFITFACSNVLSSLLASVSRKGER